MTQHETFSQKPRSASEKIQDAAYFLLPLSLSLLLFSLPISSSGKSLFLGISTVLILILMISNREKTVTAFTHPLSILGMILLGWMAIAMLWSPAESHEQTSSLKHYSKLIFIPLFLFAFIDEKNRQWAIHAFLLAMLLTFLITVFNLLGLTKLYTLEPTAIFRNHIMTSFMMSIASFIAATYAWKSKRFKWQYGILSALFAIHILFMNTGRMGYLIFFALTFTFLVQHLARKHLFIGLAAGLLVSGLIVSQSSIIQKNFKTTLDHIAAYEQGEKTTSVGFRFQFYEFAWDTLTQKPILGHGTGSYHYLFLHSGRFQSDSPGINDPHNQYLFIWFEQGLVGLLLFLAFLGYAFFAAKKAPLYKNMIQATVIAFILGCLTDSYLFYSGTGFIFCLLIALFYAETLNER